MLNSDSLDVNFLLITSSDANRKALTTNIKEVIVKSLEAGFTIIMMPINPIIVANIFVIVNFSPKNLVASIKTKIGIVKLIVVATASFPELIPMHHAAIAKNNIPPRIICRSILGVLEFFLLKNKNGISTNVPKRNLRKTTS